MSQQVGPTLKEKELQGLPWWHGGLRIWCYYYCGLGHCCSTGLVPIPGTFVCHGHSQNKTKQKQKQTNKQKKKKKKEKGLCVSMDTKKVISEAAHHSEFFHSEGCNLCKA